MEVRGSAVAGMQPTRHDREREARRALRAQGRCDCMSGIGKRLADLAANAAFGPKGQTAKELREELEELRKAQEDDKKQEGK